MNKLFTPELVTVLILYGCLAVTLISEGRVNLSEVMSFAAGGYYGYLRAINTK